jgi:hypothetical protein
MVALTGGWSGADGFGADCCPHPANINVANANEIAQKP